MPRPQPPPFLLEMFLDREAVADRGVYPYNLPAVRGLVESLEFHPRVTFLVGENGSGKSTLLEALAVALEMNAEGGGRNFQFSTKASHSPLHESIRLARGVRRQPRDTYFLRAESFYNVASEVDRLEREGPGLLDSYGGRSLHEQSHGESFLALFRDRFRGDGLYLLDEPEAALSPARQMGFLALLHDLVGVGSQFVIASHSPIILAYPDAWIYVLGEAGPRRTAYKDTEHYRITRYFLDHTEKMLGEILGET